jgi:pSer/pThr/pTyr-binding forkhead associated (FHA) protein
MAAAPEPLPVPPPQPVVSPEPPAPAPVQYAAPVYELTGRLLVQRTNTSLPIPSGKQVAVIGREDPVSGIFPAIDLDPFGAQEDGVGRQHAQLVLQNGQTCLEDLDSVNGTFVM